MYQQYNDWAADIYYAFGQIVVGSDNNLYKAKLAHLSATGNKPITGGTYTTYWVAVTPNVPRGRKPNGGIEMQVNVTDDNKRLAKPEYKAIMKKFPYKKG